MSFQHFLKQCFEKKSKRCILPVLRQKSTQKSQRGSAKCTCYSASKLSEKHKAQIFAPLESFFFASTHITLTKLFLLSKEQKKKNDCASKISNGSIRISVCNSLPNVKDVNKSVER